MSLLATLEACTNTSVLTKESKSLVKDPSTTMPYLLDIAQDLCGAGSAGLSLVIWIKPVRQAYAGKSFGELCPRTRVHHDRQAHFAGDDVRIAEQLAAQSGPGAETACRREPAHAPARDVGDRRRSDKAARPGRGSFGAARE